MSQTITEGPFDISFELNDTNGLNITKGAPEASNQSTIYTLVVMPQVVHQTKSGVVPAHGIAIRIKDYSQTVDVSFDSLRNILEKDLGNYGYTIWQTIMVGGGTGVFGFLPRGGVDEVLKEMRQTGQVSEATRRELESLENPPLYLAGYSPDEKENRGKVVVLIISTYGLDVTMQFLQTLRISTK